MMTGKYAKVPCISAMHNCLASALRGIRQGPAWHYARHLCMAKYRSRSALHVDKTRSWERCTSKEKVRCAPVFVLVRGKGKGKGKKGRRGRGR